MTIATRIYTKLFAKAVGEDEFGNKYYTLPRKDSMGRVKRMVLYAGKPEASKVPPSWHGWLHYTTDDIPTQRYKWQKDHHENLTGTDKAYFPSGYMDSDNKRAPASGDYEAWKP